MRTRNNIERATGTLVPKVLKQDARVVADLPPLSDLQLPNFVNRQADQSWLRESLPGQTVARLSQAILA
jgi:hypothetical protein